ncbi:lysophospholipid acyltransferase family protein [Thermodesulfobacteriota bacterium]
MKRRHTDSADGGKALEELKWRLVGLLGKIIIDALFATCRIHSLGLQEVESHIASRRFVFAFWHSRMLLVSYLYKGWGAGILVSQSRDGEIIARVLRRQGHEPIRGSTTRGAVRALAALIRNLQRTGRPSAIIPDGPQGPRYRVQPGVITLAKKTGYPILPVSYGARRRHVFRSWDRFILPYPFTDCAVVYGTPVSVPGTSSKEEEEALRATLEGELNRITRHADYLYARPTP